MMKIWKSFQENCKLNRNILYLFMKWSIEVTKMAVYFLKTKNGMIFSYEFLHLDSVITIGKLMNFSEEQDESGLFLLGC